MHGSIFNLLKRFVQTQYDYSTWLKLVELSGLSSADFDMNEVYPDAQIYALVGQAASMTGIPAEQLQEKFGEFLVPDLMLVYKRYVQPGWGTLEMIENTEEAMHGAVRRDAPGTRPPVLHVTRLSDKELEVQYESERRMGALAVGIIRGLATYFDEVDEIEVEPLTREDEEKVIIRVRQR
ncbi:heme NO-binding domain-containing protein [Hymenobacter cellulosivorans]|uniref:Heme NO-binding domain-containing protein n=1 Tax=Hymenobacter cellulosivorans TaxID=2932249 RepID=A0ABY4F495_9BACT|nr:heme NO-binding domain-containing protein [Hymenobacter cellulosivorans]UOQ51304.1 heme NO-binding domain-containing protein [Hymenobacter cellulosivorans]